jgi:hypothetical protein
MLSAMGFRICKIECHLARPIESQARPSWTLESIANYVFIIGDGRRGWDVPYWGYESWRYLRSWFEGDGRKSETGFSSRWTTGGPPRDSHKYSEFAWSNRRTLPTSSTTGPPLNPLAANSPPLPASPITSHPPLQTPQQQRSTWATLRLWTAGQLPPTTANRSTNAHCSWKLVEVGRVVLFSAPSPYENRYARHSRCLRKVLQVQYRRNCRNHRPQARKPPDGQPPASPRREKLTIKGARRRTVQPKRQRSAPPCRAPLKHRPHPHRHRQAPTGHRTCCAEGQVGQGQCGEEVEGERLRQVAGVDRQAESAERL